MQIKKWGSIILAIVFIGSFISVLPVTHKVDASISLNKGEEALAHIASQKVEHMEERLKQLASSEKSAATKKESYAVRFKNTVIMGDSLSQALLDYRLLHNHQVIAYRGRRIDNISEDIKKVIQLSPNIIFMGYGMNDLKYYRGDAQRFIAIYKSQVQTIKQALPKVQIYINSILPTNAKAIGETPVYGKYIEFNEAIKQMCEETDLSYIDNLPLVNWSENVYERDGVHPLFPYYPKWLSNMAEKAGL